MASVQPGPDMKTNLKASYDAMAGVYNKWTVIHSHQRLEYLDKLLDQVPGLTSDDNNTEHRVLELGCGSGDPFLTTLLAKCARVHATANDMSDTQMDLARANLAKYAPRVTLAPGDMNQLEFPDQSLAAVVAMYSIIHLPRDEQIQMVNKIATWLQPGGCFIANFSTVDTEGCVMEKWLDQEEGWMFWSGLGTEHTVSTVQQCGLKVESRILESQGEEERFVWIVATKPRGSRA